ncbi:hypothetical protein BC830DRAFT_1104585 [Chytriomyces sp. MP71]|nr:hypothetical protein BC830DRAFT_1104585 [Chytriomyces sp. MP71]
MRQKESLKRELRKAEESLGAVVLPDSRDASPRRHAFIEKSKKLIFFTSYDNMRGCVTAFEKQRLVTFGHGIHMDLQIGSSMNIYSGFDLKEVKATVTFRDDEKDFIILQTTKDVCDTPPTLASPHQGEEYVQFGFSAPSQNNTPLTISAGVFTSTEYMAKTHHFLGSAGAYFRHPRTPLTFLHYVLILETLW